MVMVINSALCGGLAWIIFAPMAVLIARLGRKFTGWLRFHQLINGILTGSLTVAAFALGIVAINKDGSAHFASSHARLGLVIFILVLLQILLGFYIHHKFESNRTHRPFRNVSHFLLGCTLLLCGFIQVSYGLKLYVRHPPGYIWAVYWLSLAATVLAYLISLGRLVQSRRDGGLSWGRAIGGFGRPLPNERKVMLQNEKSRDYFEQRRSRALQRDVSLIRYTAALAHSLNKSTASPTKSTRDVNAEPETPSQRAARQWAESVTSKHARSESEWSTFTQSTPRKIPLPLHHPFQARPLPPQPARQPLSPTVTREVINQQSPAAQFMSPSARQQSFNVRDPFCPSAVVQSYPVYANPNDVPGNPQSPGRAWDPQSKSYGPMRPWAQHALPK